MLIRALSTAIVFLASVGFVHADEFAGTLVKVADGKITFARGVGKKKKDFTLPADDKCRVFVAKYDAKTKKIEAGDAIADGLKNAIFDQLDKQPIEAWIRTNADNTTILELRLYQSMKKKAK